MTLKIISSFSEDLCEIILPMRVLLRQLTGDDEAVDNFSTTTLKDILTKQEAYIATVWTDDGKTLIGMGMLFLRHEGLKITGFIGEVVVDEPYQRRGCARIISESLIAIAHEKGVNFIELTSNSNNPKREGAIVLYKSLGFIKPQTSYFRLYL